MIAASSRMPMTCSKIQAYLKNIRSNFCAKGKEEFAIQKNSICSFTKLVECKKTLNFSKEHQEIRCWHCMITIKYFTKRFKAKVAKNLLVSLKQLVLAL